MSEYHAISSREAVVLISIYAGDKPSYFRVAMESVLSQCLPSDVRLKVFLAVDGPVGQDMECVLQEYAPKIFFISRSDENVGLGGALNRLIDASRGADFFFRMDADDVCLPGRFQSQIEFLDRHETIDILGGAIVEFSEDLGWRRLATYFSGVGDLRQSLCWRVPVAHPTVCFRGRVFDAVRGYPTSKGNEDVSLWFACAKAGLRFGNIDVPLLEFRVTSNFWARRSFKKAIDELLAYERGIYSLFGLSWRALIPLLRFCFRLLPAPIVKLGYRLRALGR